VFVQIIGDKSRADPLWFMALMVEADIEPNAARVT
jgi:hypothetical protein